MYLYINEFFGNYGAGIIIVAARNASRAMEIIREQNEDDYLDENLEQIVGAAYEGKEGVINQLVYRE